MQNYTPSIFTNGFANGNVAVNKPEPFKRKYVATCYQGDVAFITPFKDTAVYATGAALPTGSICYINAAGEATPGLPTLTDLKNCPVPYIVYVGNDQMSVKSQKGNTAGGTVSLVPCTGYYRFVTTVFNNAEGTTYKAGDFLTAALTNGSTVKSVADADYPTAHAGVATPVTTGVYTDIVIGIVDTGITKDHFNLDSLRFTCYFIPPTSVAASSNNA